eukprot:Stramenopile-MAST_4_protein_187
MGCASSIQPQDNYVIRYLAEGETAPRRGRNLDAKQKSKAKYKQLLKDQSDGGNIQRRGSTGSLPNKEEEDTASKTAPRRSMSQAHGGGRGGKKNARFKRAAVTAKAAVRFKRHQNDPSHWLGAGPLVRGKYSLSEFEVDKKPLGKGSAGYVKLARHMSENGYYALKLVSKEKVVKHRNGPKHLRNEKDILSDISDSPFFIKCFGTFQDPVFVYFVLSYVPGGELHRLLFVQKRFSNDMAMFYSAEILLAMEYLHSMNIMYRDLKPENILLGLDGHVVICDLGFAARMDTSGKCHTKVGTPHYLAPEILDMHSNKGYTQAVDIWSWALVTYEMLRGRPAFGTAQDTAYQVYLRVMKAKYKMPTDISSCAKQLIRNLLQCKIEKRMINPDTIKSQKWFANVDWMNVQNKRLVPPHFPDIGGPGCREAYEIKLTMPDYKKVSAQDDSHFVGF